MSIFNPNYSLLNKYITEAEEEEDRYSINDSEFDIEDDESDNDEDSSNDTNENDGTDEADEILKAADEDNNNSENENNTEDSTENSEDSDTSNNDENESDEFDINLDGDDPSDDSGEAEDGGEADESNPGDDNPSSDSDSSNVANELIDKEKEIFSDLSEKQMKIKVNELKKSYTTFLSVIDDISNKISTMPKNDENMKIIKFISSKLLDLKNIVNDYLIDTFDTKTYIENTIFYQTNLAQLNTIKKVLEDMATKVKNEDNKK